MKKMLKPMLSVLLMNLLIATLTAQNVGIGTASPHSSAMLDVQSTNKGMLVPRIALTAANAAAPVTSPADALLVYNTATAGTGSNAIVPGFYYWNASAARWNAMKESSTTSSVGFGPWGDCSMGAISEYNPVVDETGAAGEYFGNSVYISGNYAIVGAYGDQVGQNANQGSASIYQYNGTNWVLMNTITDATGAANDNFGYSVSISGNYAIIGAYADDVGANVGQGSASIYKYNGTNWVLMNKISDATGAATDFFGTSVSISGNYAIVGSPYENIGANLDQGSASIYKYNGTNWVLMNKITDATGAQSDYFGRSVSISGSYAIVGANGDDIGPNADQGSVSFYQYNGTNWTWKDRITDAASAAGDNFGWSVSVSGNYAIVGAYADDVEPNVDQGSASIYKFNEANWVLMYKIIDVSGSTYDNFGWSVSISGDYVIVGAPDENIGANPHQGSATIYRRVGLGWQKLQYLVDPGGNTLDYFGFSTSIDGASKRFINGVPYYTGRSGKVVFGKVN